MDCIFCKIVKGESPSYKVYEDDLFLGFLDIFPLSKGHALLIPKKHYRWVNDVPEFGAYWEASRTMSRLIEKKLGATSISYLTMGEDVFHAHIHIVPRYNATDTYFTLTKPRGYSKEEMEEIFRSLS